MGYQQLAEVDGQKFVLAFLKQQTSPELFEIDVKKHRFDKILFRVNENEKLVGIGLYKKGSKLFYSGTGLFLLDPEDKTIRMTTQEIEKEDFDAALGEVQPDFNISRDYFQKARIKEVITKRNAYYVIGERVHVTAESQFSDNRIRYNNNFLNNRRINNLSLIHI